MKKGKLKGLCLSAIISLYSAFLPQSSLDDKTAYEYENYAFPIADEIPVKNRKEAFEWVVNNIENTPDLLEFWQPPDITVKRGKGDCEDKAILLMYFFRKLGIDTYFVNYLPETNQDCTHSIVQDIATGEYYDPTGENPLGNIFYSLGGQEIKYKLKYGNAIKYAVLYHEKPGWWTKKKL